MTILNYTITCQCGHEEKGSFSHGDSCRDRSEIRCDHFIVKPHQKTHESGFFEFGSKNECTMKLHIICKSCKKEKNMEQGYWGWTVGDAKQDSIKCCDMTLTFKSYES